ncbi:receptor-type adenylate cyclase, partial [Trypanosoma grayi]|uniref:receptor-type adenylate cyclase n=1 Tax=Trypanosoma grayi TaxID=71804 RepID=UPI0004F459D9
QQFHAAVKDRTKWTPLALRGFATVRLMRSVAARMDKVGAKHLADFFYTNIMVTVDDMHYGPFYDGVDCGTDVGDVTCGVNYGASSLSVWTLSRVAAPALPVFCFTGEFGTDGRKDHLVSVQVLSAKHYGTDGDSRSWSLLNAGLRASLLSRNYLVSDGVRVRIIEVEAHASVFAMEVEDAVRVHKNLLTVLSFYGDDQVRYAMPALVKHGLVSFAPFTASSLIRRWSPNLYFVRADPLSELVTLLRYSVNRLRVRRLGFMYLQDVGFGDPEYQLAMKLMTQMSSEPCGVFTLKSSVTGAADDAVFKDVWEKFANTLPQAVIVFGAPVNDTAKFVRNMLTDGRTRQAHLLGPYALQETLLSTWRQAVSSGVPFKSGQVITTGTNPLAKDKDYEAIKRFQRDMKRYLRVNKDDFNTTDHFLNNDNDGELMVAGWIAGEVFSQALSNRNDLKDRETFRRSLFNQRRYVVDDLVIGDFGGECRGAAVSQRATCRCNQGGRTVYMKRFVEGYRAEVVKDGLLTYSASQCY